MWLCDEKSAVTQEPSVILPTKDFWQCLSFSFYIFFMVSHMVCFTVTFSLSFNSFMQQVISVLQQLMLLS